jgi:hypothetical protein
MAATKATIPSEISARLVRTIAATEAMQSAPTSNLAAWMELQNYRLSLGLTTRVKPLHTAKTVGALFLIISKAYSGGSKCEVTTMRTVSFQLLVIAATLSAGSSTCNSSPQNEMQDFISQLRRAWAGVSSYHETGEVVTYSNHPQGETKLRYRYQLDVQVHKRFEVRFFWPGGELDDRVAGEVVGGKLLVERSTSEQKVNTNFRSFMAGMIGGGRSSPMWLIGDLCLDQAFHFVPHRLSKLSFEPMPKIERTALKSDNAWTAWLSSDKPAIFEVAFLSVEGVTQMKRATSIRVTFVDQAAMEWTRDTNLWKKSLSEQKARAQQ